MTDEAMPFEDEACDIYREMCIDEGFYAEWDDAIAIVRRAIRAIRALPVEQRMEAMGMERVQWNIENGKPVWVES